jgi:predicted nucleotidyltransferase
MTNRGEGEKVNKNDRKTMAVERGRETVHSLYAFVQTQDTWYKL